MPPLIGILPELRLETRHHRMVVLKVFSFSFFFFGQASSDDACLSEITTQI